MRCGRCGSANNEGNRFCGMCGAPMTAVAPGVNTAPLSPPPAPERRPEVVRPPADERVAGQVVVDRAVADQRVSQNVVHGVASPSSVPEIPRVAVQPPIAAPRRPERMVDDPYISGPSFLGLNRQSGAQSTGSTPKYSDAPSETSRSTTGNLDYLLDDEEEPRRGWGKLAVVVIALALLGGFGYLRWKQGGFDWLLHNKQLTQSGETSTSAADPGTAQNTGPSADSATPNTAPATSAESGAGAKDTASPSPDTSGAAGGQQATPANAAGAATSSAPGPNDAQPNNPPAQSSPDASETTTRRPDSAAAKEGTSRPAEDSTAPEAGPASAANTSKPEAPSKPNTPQRKPSPVTPVDSMAEAERYIYGRGVRQDCDRGLRLLKPAAAQSNPQAMITLGELYSSGTCTPRDLPTSYRWYALALHKEPDNRALQNDLQKLWSQMTQPERQLAIKLSH